MARLLLVDDEPQLLFSVREYLSRVGYEVDAVESGAEALATLMERPPDLVVSDVLMDEMDGFELQSRVNALTGGGIPFIFLTAKGDLRDRLTGLRAGADDYVVKPFEPEELQARIASILARVEVTRRQERADLQRLRSRALAEAAEQAGSPLADVVSRLDRLVAEAAEGPLEGGVEALVSELANVAEDPLADLAIRKEPTRMAPIVRTAAANAARAAAQKGVDLQVSCGGLLGGLVDVEALRRALTALLEAAVETTPEGGQVGIRARRAREGGLEIRITDGGAGLSEGGPTVRPEGSSLAMEYARRVIKAHGGTFETHCEDGRCSIVMWLPGRVARRVGRKP